MLRLRAPHLRQMLGITAVLLFHWSGGATAADLSTGGTTKKVGAYVAVPQFQNAYSFSEGLAAVQVDGKWGFVDKTGKVAIEPQFNPNQAQFNARFSDGLVAINFDDASSSPMRAVGYDTEWGFADRRGVVVINPQFRGDYYSPPVFSEGLAAIRLGFKYGYIDKAGSMAIAATFDEARRFSQGFAVVKVGEKEGYIDKTGAIVVKPAFDSARAFSEGLAVVTVAGKDGLIDRTGKFVVEPRFDSLGPFSEGLAQATLNGVSHLGPGGSAITDDSSKEQSTSPARYGYVNRTGQIVVAPQFPVSLLGVSGDFSEGLATVMFPAHAAKNSLGIEGKYGFIDHAGHLAINPKFDFAWGFSEGLAAVRIGKKYGYIDRAGQMVIAPQFDSAESFRDGLALVGVGDKFGFIAR